MSILSSIKHAVFGETAPWDKGFIGHKPGTPAPGSPVSSGAPADRPIPQQAAPGQANPADPEPPAPPANPPAGQTAPQTAVNVQEVLLGKMQEKGNPNLDYKHSIVDLMKLLDLDPSLDNRKQLATELGYTGEKNGSAEMNMWLHRAVMEDLEKSGGAVPNELKH